MSSVSKHYDRVYKTKPLETRFFKTQRLHFKIVNAHDVFMPIMLKNRRFYSCF